MQGISLSKFEFTDKDKVVIMQPFLGEIPWHGLVINVLATGFSLEFSWHQSLPFCHQESWNAPTTSYANSSLACAFVKCTPFIHFDPNSSKNNLFPR
ncbi:hypothetical protein V6N11_065175 [Hibiscus sabdariffa]|uniref:Uncharacterized protein n=1 Tax=Hibiscus sabdariffa TaxID=183260 RepID=A0ABR2QGP9_9ROSI